MTLYGGAIFVSMLSHLSHVSHYVYIVQAAPPVEACRRGGSTALHAARKQVVAGSILDAGLIFFLFALRQCSIFLRAVL